MGLKKINQELCLSSCGLCAEECPYDVIDISKDTKKAFIRYPADCHECYYFYMCARVCPAKAIETDPKIAGYRWYATP